jgi:hypothetical protein
VGATQITLWVGVVVGLVELGKFGGLPHRWGLLLAAILSAGAVWVEISVEGFQLHMLREYISGWAAILFSAAGVYGFVRSVRPEDVTDGTKR